MSRKIFLIIVAVLLAIIIGALLYLFVFSKKTETEPVSLPSLGETVPSTPLEVTPEPAPLVPEVSKVTRVVENKVLAFALKEKEILYYDQDQRGFFRAKLDGSEPLPYGKAEFTNVIEVIWSPDKTQAILGFTDSSYYHFDIASGQSTKLMPNISKISWVSAGEKIIFEWREDENEVRLIISEPDGDNWEKIKDLGYAKIILGASPQIGGPVVMLQNYSYGTARNIYPVYQDGSAGAVISLEGYGDKAKWSRDGMRILYEAVDAENFEQYLWVVDITGTNQYNLGIKSFIEKCVWNKTNDKLYCAVPSQPLGSQATVEDESIDNFWEINTKTGGKRKLYDESESDTKFDAENLWVNQKEDRLYFTDAAGGVYMLRLD